MDKPGSAEVSTGRLPWNRLLNLDVAGLSTVLLAFSSYVNEMNKGRWSGESKAKLS
jgi:hypothetical protein